MPRGRSAARKTEIDGYIFDSKKEGDDYLYLLSRLQAGEISDLVLQPVFTLQEGFRDKSGKWHRPITYRADFQFTENRQTVVWESKGYKENVYRIKEKLFRYKYPDLDFRVS